MSAEREQRFLFSPWKIALAKEVRIYLFWVLLGRPGILCGFIGRESSFNNDAKYEGVTRDTPLLENSRESLKKWLYHESWTGQDWIWTWCIHERKAAIAELGVCVFLPSLNSITKKTTAVHDILFVFMHMGWLAWIAVIMRLRRRIVWTVNMVQAFLLPWASVDANTQVIDVHKLLCL